MRRDNREGIFEGDNFKIIMYIAGIVLAISIMVFIVVFVFYNDKLDSEAELSLIEMGAAVNTLVPNSTAENLAQASITEDKTVGEVKNTTVVEIERKTTNIVRKYESAFPESADKVATCLHYNLLHLYKALEEQTPEILRAFDNNIGKLNAMKFAFRAANSKLTQPIFADTPYGITPIPGTDMDDILSMYNSLMMQALLQDSLGFSTYMDKKLDEIYAEFERLEIPTSKSN